MKFWTVDAFTNKPFHGNPAAVLLVEDFPTDALCQTLAAEFNLSETAFVKTLGPNHFHIRWFTPNIEVKLCGHATLASCYVLKLENLIDPKLPIILESLSGPLSVTCEAEIFTLDFPLQKTSQALDKAIFTEMLGLPVAKCVQAYDDVIVELLDATSVQNFQPDFAKIKQLDCRGLIITAQSDGKPYDFVSRFFDPRGGVNEDPVTGSAHCKLADYWQTKLKRSEFFVYQASKRGGEITIKIKGDRVLLTGTSVLITKGVLV